MKLATKLLSLLSLAAADAAVCVGILGAATGARVCLLLAAHAAIALGAAAALLLAAPPAVLRAKASFVGFSFAMCFFIPAAAPLGLWAVLAFGLVARREKLKGAWKTFDVDRELDLNRRPASRSRRSVTASELAGILRVRTPETADRRFQALLQVRHLPAKTGVALLKVALKDPSDEVRLFAFARIEKFRDELETKIKNLSQSLAPSNGYVEDDERARVLLRLAESYWEIAYLSLAEGAVLDHTLRGAKRCAVEACQLLPGNAPAEYLLGRVLVYLKELPDAGAALERAIGAGYPRTKIVPWLAECAFLQRRFDVVREVLRDADAAVKDNHFLAPVVEFWRE